MLICSPVPQPPQLLRPISHVSDTCSRSTSQGTPRMECEAHCDTPSDDSPWSAVHVGWHHGEAGILLHRSLHQNDVRCHQLPVSSTMECTAGGVGVGVNASVGVCWGGGACCATLRYLSFNVILGGSDLHVRKSMFSTQR